MWSSWKIRDISSCNPNISLSLPVSKTHIGHIHTSLLSSHRHVFPVLVPVPSPFPQSGRRTSLPCLYLLCVLWQNRGKWLWRWRGPRALWLDTNKKLLSYKAYCDRKREKESGETSTRGEEPRQEVHPLWGPKKACCLLSVDTVWLMEHPHWSRQKHYFIEDKSWVLLISHYWNSVNC